MFSLMGNCISCIKRNRQPKRSIKLAILGLDSAGKTTTTKALIGDDLETAPTIGFSKEEFTFGSYEITIYDLGGGRKIRDIWKDYLAEIYGIVYVIDSSTRERIQEVKENLTTLLSHEKVQGKPLLVLANKVDLPDHMNEVDIMEGLNLEDIVNRNKCATKLEMCSAIKGTGKKMDVNISNGMKWLCGILNQVYDKLKLRVDKDVAIMEEQQQREKEARKERVKKAREERARLEEEERKRLGMEKEEEDDDDDDIVEGDPFRKLTAADIQRKEEKYRKAKEREKEKKKRLKELEAQDRSNNALTTENSISKTTTAFDNDDSDDFRAPRASRNIYSLGIINGGFNKPVLGSKPKDDSDDDNEHLSNVPRAGRQMLPPLQSPLGTKFMGNSPRPGKEKKKGKRFKNKPVETITEIDSDRTNHVNGVGDVGYEPLSYSRIQVVSEEPESDNTDEIVDKVEAVRGGRKMYITNQDAMEDSIGGRKKEKKKKSQLFSNEENEDFDTLRLSQHLDEDVVKRYSEHSKPPLSPVGGDSARDSGDAVKKLKKKKKKPPLRKNRLAPSDDEFELSDVTSSPHKQPLPWTRTPSPRKMLDNADTHTNWGLADDLMASDDISSFQQRRRPNFDSEDDIVL